MPKYDHCQHVLSDWLAELDQRFQLAEARDDTNKITWCQLLIGATGSSILSSLEEEVTWEDAKEALLNHLDIGSVIDEAWAALKNLKKGSKDIVELTGEAEKLAKRLHPGGWSGLSPSSPPPNRLPPTTLLPLWWRGTCSGQLSCTPYPPMPPPTAGVCQQPWPASRTHSEATNCQEWHTSRP